MNNMIPVGIVGVSGYTGLELVKILLFHPNFKLVYVANTEGDTILSTLHPSLEGVTDMRVSKFISSEAADRCELVFLALPHKAAMNSAKELLALGVRIVDLSADYRLSIAGYEEKYCKHEDLENLAHAVYSIPELHGKKAHGAKLIANPGCHVTASLLALVPFLPYIDLSQPIFIDSKTGVSGAGKTPTAGVHFVSVNENINSYNIIKHRHATEIMEHATALCGESIKVTFVPSLIPITRGMIATVYATLKSEIDCTSVLENTYKDKEFVRLRSEPPHAKSVSGTHFADLFATRDCNALVSFCAIDNLLRGASSQAVANANLMYGFEEGLALPKIAYAP
jgi:N-acetyl-gamma-glutamyl-phosphate reductase